MNLFGEDDAALIYCRVDGCIEPPEAGSRWCFIHQAPDPLLPRNAGQTQREMQERREPSTSERATAIKTAIRKEPGLTDYDLEEITGMAHEKVSAARNRLMRLGELTLKYDPTGKRHPLARTIDGRKHIEATGPWEVKIVDGVSLLRWYLPEQL